MDEIVFNLQLKIFSIRHFRCRVLRWNFSLRKFTICNSDWQIFHLPFSRSILLTKIIPIFNTKLAVFTSKMSNFQFWLSNFQFRIANFGNSASKFAIFTPKMPNFHFHGQFVSIFDIKMANFGILSSKLAVFMSKIPNFEFWLSNSQFQYPKSTKFSNWNWKYCQMSIPLKTPRFEFQFAMGNQPSLFQKTKFTNFFWSVSTSR